MYRYFDTLKIMSLNNFINFELHNSYRQSIKTNYLLTVFNFPKRKLLKNSLKLRKTATNTSY